MTRRVMLLPLLETGKRSRITGHGGKDMTVRGRVKNGKVLLDDPRAIAEGTEVEVRPRKPPKSKAKVHKPKSKSRPRSLAERLANVIGRAKNLPADASINVDHYLYGLPKRQ